MNVKKLCLILYSVFMVAGFSTFFFGECGLLAMYKLQAERDRLAANMEKLKLSNRELTASLSALQSDPDTLALYARELGFSASPDERFIRVAGSAPAARRVAQAGNLLKAVPPAGASDKSVRLFAGLLLLAALIMAIFSQPASFWSSFMQFNRRKSLFSRRPPVSKN